MGDYSDLLSVYNINSAYGNSTQSTQSAQSYSQILKSLTGVDSTTGLEGLTELGGDDDNSDFMSILSGYLGNSQTNMVDKAMNTAMAEKLEGVMAGMDEQSEEYKSVQDVYNYFVKLNSSSSVLSSLYGNSGTASAGASEAAGADSSAEQNALSGISTNFAMNIIDENSIESDIESSIESSIDVSGIQM